MGLVDLRAEAANTAAPNPLQALPRTAGERFEAEWATTFAPDRYFTQAGALRERAETVIGQLRDMTGETLANPYGPVTSEEMLRLGNQPAVTAERLARLREKAAAARAMVPEEGALPAGFLDTDFEGQIAAEATKLRQRSGRYEGTGGGLAAFAAGAIGETLTPAGLIGLAIPVTRLPMAASSAIGRSFVGNVAREAGFQAGANAGLQGVTEALDFASRRQFGTEQTPGEVLTNLAGAATIGAAIGGGVRALHLKLLGLPLRDAPLEVRDAARVIEADALYSGQNRLGVEPGLHERAFDGAVRDILLGRPVRLAETMTDTPMTALGTILRSGPDNIRAQIGGLGDALDRIRALPDTEIEAVARQARPQAFAQLDRVRGELAEVESKLADLDHGLQSITTADLVDPLSGARLADIEDRLGARGLKAKERRQLERERDQITESLDPEGRLPAELERTRRELETPEEAAARADLTTRRAGLQRELDVAGGEASREVAAFRSKLDQQGVGALRAFADEVDPVALQAEGMGITPDLAGRLERMLRDAELDRLRQVTAPLFRTERLPTGGQAAARIDPLETKALDLEAERVVLEGPMAKMEFKIGDRTMTAADAIAAADRQISEAEIAMNCAAGAL